MQLRGHLSTASARGRAGLRVCGGGVMKYQLTYALHKLTVAAVMTHHDDMCTLY
jgi:hypothetical protein